MSRIDDIFQVKKLRKNWKQAQTIEESSMKEDSQVLLTEEGSKAIEEYENLRKLINQRFPGEKSIALNIMLEEINGLMLNLFSSGADEEKTGISLNIDEKLCQIEDIVEALEIGDK